LSSAHSSAGRLYVVGIGPGDAAQVTRQATEVLTSVDCIVGYEGYINLVRQWLPQGNFSSSAIGHEIERATEAVARAVNGGRIALIGSGDAGVYGLAGLALQTLAERDASELPVEVVPGVTAATAAAALLGAPLGHDFAVISLSDLLTPWETVHKRIEAAAAADFVTVFYNPASRARRSGLQQAMDIFRRYRDPITPVGQVESAYRAGQRVHISTLGTFNPGSAGMLSTIVIGNAATFAWNARMITPRGYATG
jgi:precorrin-3B C17-methyltransferase